MKNRDQILEGVKWCEWEYAKVDPRIEKPWHYVNILSEDGIGCTVRISWPNKEEFCGIDPALAPEEPEDTFMEFEYQWTENTDRDAFYRECAIIFDKILETHIDFN